MIAYYRPYIYGGIISLHFFNFVYKFLFLLLKIRAPAFK